MKKSNKILVVDDEKHVSDFYAALLDTKNHAYVCVSSGEAALEKISTEDFALVISDMMMPGINGTELLETIAEHHDTRRILISGALGSEEQMSGIRDSGIAHQVLSKPCSISRFLEAVDQELKAFARGAAEAA